MPAATSAGSPAVLPAGPGRSLLTFASSVQSRPRPQGGFALMMVLAVIAVTSILIGALFGLMLVTMRVTDAQERSARESRAADAAIETAINRLRTEQCDPTTPLMNGIAFDQQTTGTGDDVSVDVSCSSVPGNDTAADQVRIVGGDGYQGALRSALTTDCSGGATAGCLPWSSAIGSVPSGSDTSNISLVHSGSEPLRFSSGVTVRSGSAALRNPTSGAPAVEVGGDYNQGAAGIGGAGGTDCGMLDGDPGNGAGQIADMDASPSCGVAQAAAVDARPTGDTAGIVAPTATPVVPATCGAGPVVTFTPGTYPSAATTAVSRLTDGSQAACRNKTFHFSPGVYSFQGTELRFADRGSYYVFGAASGWGAGGVQAEAALVADADAQLCDTASSGTTLVLAGWTRLTHTGGRVAVCPNRPAGTDASGNPLDPHPALYQQTAVPTEVTVTSIVRNPGPANNINLPFRCRTGSLITGFTYPAASDYPSGISGPCRPRRIYDLNLSTSGLAPIQSLRVMITATENPPNNLVTDRQSRFILFAGGGAELCRTDFVDGMPNGDMTASFDLKTMPGGCSTTALTQAQLDSGRIRVEHQMDMTFPLLNPRTQLVVDSAAIEVNAVSGRVSASGVQSSDWTNPGAAAVAGGAAAEPVMSCADFVCAVADPSGSITPARQFVHEMTFSGFQFPGLLNSSDPSVDPELRTLRAVVGIQPSSLTSPAGWPADLPPESFRLPGRVSLELRSPTGARCIVQGQGMNSDQEIAFNLLDTNLEDPSASNCNTMPFDSASDLNGVTLRLRFEMTCVPDYPAGMPGRCFRSLIHNPALPVWQISPPDIDSVQLTTVTNTYSRAETSTVTVDAAGGASSASFNVYGRTWMPLADLDINWNGPATTAPLFSQDLVLHGLGSTMASGAAMGIVCCTPASSRTVELVATIDGVERLTARVLFGDVDTSGPVPVPALGRQVDVLRWLRCANTGCASVLAASDERSTTTTTVSPGP